MAVQLRSKYVLGEFEVDTEKYLLKRNNEHLHLADLPFQVFLYLVEHRDRYVSKKEYRIGFDPAARLHVLNFQSKQACWL